MPLYRLLAEPVMMNRVTSLCGGGCASFCTRWTTGADDPGGGGSAQPVVPNGNHGLPAAATHSGIATRSWPELDKLRQISNWTFSNFRPLRSIRHAIADKSSIFRPVRTFADVYQAATGRSVKSRCHSAGIRDERRGHPRSRRASCTRCSGARRFHGVPIAMTPLGR
jgi:hypothetical protein